MSKIAISETKSLDLGENIFERLTPFSLSSLLNLCAKNVERIRIPNRQNSVALLDTLAQYSCPGLVELGVEARDAKDEQLNLLIQKNENLQTFTWHGNYPQFPDLIRENLVVLRLVSCDSATFRSLTGRIPNLNTLVASITIEVEDGQQIFDQFFHFALSLETLHLEMDSSFGIKL